MELEETWDSLKTHIELLTIATEKNRIETLNRQSHASNSKLSYLPMFHEREEEEINWQTTFFFVSAGWNQMCFGVFFFFFHRKIVSIQYTAENRYLRQRMTRKLYGKDGILLGILHLRLHLCFFSLAYFYWFLCVLPFESIAVVVVVFAVLFVIFASATHQTWAWCEWQI